MEDLIDLHEPAGCSVEDPGVLPGHKVIYG